MDGKIKVLWRILGDCMEMGANKHDQFEARFSAWYDAGQ
jgi:hypothetical protein